MARRNPPAKWVLPDVVNPTGRKTITLCIPDEPQHIAAFRGALQALGSAYNWADDEAHTAKDVAQVWRDVIDIGDNCMEFRQDGCHLYLVANGIETMIYNGQECIDNNIADGTLAKANSGYIGPMAAGSCHTYTVKLGIGDNWICPNAINSGDTILLSNWQGGATDLGQLEVFWTCPSGTAYNLGNCSDTVRSPTIYGTDPLQSAPHLAVIGQIGSTYYDVWNSTSGISPAEYTVPGGVVNQPFHLQMNIGALVGEVATGEMWGEVTVCNKSRWCKQWDFSMGNQQGWTPRFYTVMNSNGWSDTNNNLDDAVYIDIGGLPAYTADTLQLEFLENWTGTAPRIYYANVQQPQQYNGYSDLNGTKKITIPISMSGEALAIVADRYVGGAQYYGTQRLQVVRLMGGGNNPFGSSNCP